MLALALLASPVPSAMAAGADSREPLYYCRVLCDEQKKCAFDPHCDQQVIERLKRECLRDGGRP